MSGILPSTTLSRAHEGYEIKLDPISARLVVIGRLASIPPNREVHGGGFLMFKQAGWDRTPDGQTFWNGGGWRVSVVCVEDGKKIEGAAIGATPEEAMSVLEQALLAEIQDPDMLAAAQKAVKEAQESREEIPSHLCRSGT